jgi:hypothetical protein
VIRKHWRKSLAWGSHSRSLDITDQKRRATKPVKRNMRRHSVVGAAIRHATVGYNFRKAAGGADSRPIKPQRLVVRVFCPTKIEKSQPGSDPAASGQ